MMCLKQATLISTAVVTGVLTAKAIVIFLSAVVIEELLELTVDTGELVGLACLINNANQGMHDLKLICVITRPFNALK